MFKDISIDHQRMVHRDTQNTAVRFIIAIFITVLCAMCIYILALSEPAQPILRGLALTQLDKTGVDNPVTAVLLNYRSYDTLLEIALLYVVVLSLYSCLFNPNEPNLPPIPTFESHVIVRHFLRAFIPLIILIGGYLLWTGAYEPGGAFQAGAIIASGFIVVRVVGEPIIYPQWVDTLCIALATATFVSVAMAVGFFEGTILTFPAGYAAGLILLIEIAATLSIALSLYIFYRMLGRL